MTDQQKRYVGLDVHKHYVMVGAVNRTQEMVLPPRKVRLAEFEAWAKKHLRRTDEVVLEATTNAWYIYDLLEPLVERVVGMIPAVWVPPHHVRELRALMNHRQRLIAQQTRTKNRLRSLLQRQHLVPPDRDLFSEAQRAWWPQLKLNPSEKLRARQDLIILDQLGPLIGEVETEIQRLSVTEP